MDIDQVYQSILNKLSGDSRSLIRYSPSELEFLSTTFASALTSGDLEAIEKVLCLMDHSAADHSPWEDLLIQGLKQDLPPRLIVFHLNCSRKHVIQARFKKGHRLHFDYLQVLQKLLLSPSPEVVEWTLRTIEECGNQGVFFLKDFDRIKPPPWKWFNAHHRAVRELITMLERRWSRFEKP